MTPNPWHEYPLSFWDNRPDIHSEMFLKVAEFANEFQSVIEVGCGVGRLRKILKCTDYTGIDLSPQAVVAAAKDGPDDDSTRFVCGDFRIICHDFQHVSERFDCAIACNVLDHLPHFTDGLSALFRVALHCVVVSFANVLEDRQTTSYRDDGCYNNTYRRQDVLDYVDYCGRKVVFEGVLNRYTGHERLGTLMVFEPPELELWKRTLKRQRAT